MPFLRDEDCGGVENVRFVHPGFSTRIVPSLRRAVQRLRPSRLASLMVSRLHRRRREAARNANETNRRGARGGLRKRSRENAWNSRLPQPLFEKPALRVPNAAMRRAGLVTSVRLTR